MILGIIICQCYGVVGGGGGGGGSIISITYGYASVEYIRVPIN